MREDCALKVGIAGNLSVIRTYCAIPSICNQHRFQRALGVAAMAENAAKEAEIVRGAAVAEREAAVHEAKVIRETMEVRITSKMLR